MNDKPYENIEIIETTMGSGMTCFAMSSIKEVQNRTGCKVYSNFKLNKRYGINYELLNLKEVLS